MKLRYERGALADLEEIFSCIVKESPEAAAWLVARIEQAAARIAERPYLGPREIIPFEGPGPSLAALPRISAAALTEAQLVAVALAHAAYPNASHAPVELPLSASPARIDTRRADPVHLTHILVGNSHPSIGGAALLNMAFDVPAAVS